MSPTPQRGILVLADISGFTRFLAETELEHAHDILAEILELVVQRLTPVLTLAEVEGDAVFAYASQDRFPRGETLLELIEQTYGLFLGRVEAIRLHTTCTCSACNAIPILDLKFIVHDGDFILQSVGTGVKPLGSAVNLAHRLLKNGVGEATGWRAYALFTQAAVEGLDLPTEGMHTRVEQYENLEPVRTYSCDLRERWSRQLEAHRVYVDPGASDLSLSIDLAAPPPVVWTWLNDPKRRTQWVGITHQRMSGKDVRSGVGTTTHCTHGSDLESIHTVRDWRPFDYFTEEVTRPNGKPVVLVTTELTETASGTRLDVRNRVLMGPRLVTVPVLRRMSEPDQRRNLQNLQRLVAQPDLDHTPAGA
jgi:uncharacterized protein YndB with AHSA1/START domain